MTTKTCTICKEDKSITGYHKDSSRLDGLYPYCKPCRKVFTSKSYYDNPQRQRERAMKHNYGMTFDELKVKAEAQDYACEICSRDFKADFDSWNHRQVNIDHCHTTGAVRGILCQDCNHLLGRAHDDTKTLRAAIKYLTKYQGE